MGERFGVTLIAQVLRGSSQKRIRDLGFNKLSTYSLLRNRSEKDIVDTINYLLAEGYLLLTDGKYPVVKVTPKAVPVLKGSETVMMKKNPAPDTFAVESEENLNLFELLRVLRKGLADEEGVPPFVIFGDSTLKEMCRYYPVTEASMLQIKGVGQTKFAKYGEAFMKIIKQFILDNDIETDSIMIPVSSEKRMKATEDQEEQPSHLISYQWYVNGMSIEEIAKKRQLTKITVQKHIIRSVQDGQPLNWTEIFDEETEQKVINAIQLCGIEKLKPIWEALNGEIDYFVIQTVICKNQLK
jgi:ATP-dependent DNA helicase RecQ